MPYRTTLHAAPLLVDFEVSRFGARLRRARHVRLAVVWATLVAGLAAPVTAATRIDPPRPSWMEPLPHRIVPVHVALGLPCPPPGEQEKHPGTTDPPGVACFPEGTSW